MCQDCDNTGMIKTIGWNPDTNTTYGEYQDSVCPCVGEEDCGFKGVTD